MQENQSRAPEKYLRRRLDAAAEKLDENGVQAMVVTDPASKGYLSGFTTGVFIAPGGNLLLTSGDHPDWYITGGVDYEECNDALTPLGFEVTAYNYSKDLTPLTETVRILDEIGLDSVGVEKASITHGDFLKMRDALAEVDIELSPLDPVIPALREVKDEYEIAQIKKASEASKVAFEKILPMIRPGLTEWELAASLEHQLRLHGRGSSKLAFQSIVVSGPRSSLPHGSVTGRRLQEGDLVTLDFGATYNGYCADVTRTFAIGAASEKQRAVYSAVLDGQLAAIELMRTGHKRTEAAEAAVSLITDRGFGEYMAHGGGGHGIGLEVHEGPRTSGKGCWQAGNVMTIEPGVYIPGWGGVRIEDNIVITDEGPVNITDVPKELLEIR